MSNTKFDDPSEILPPGEYSFTATFRGSICIEEGEELSLIDALDEAMKGSEMSDWEVTGK